MSPDAVQAALATVNDPEIRRPITELDMVKAVDVDGGRVAGRRLCLTVAGCPMKETLTRDVTRGRREPSPRWTTSRSTLDVMSDEQRQALKDKLRGGGRPPGRSRSPSPAR